MSLKCDEIIFKITKPYENTNTTNIINIPSFTHTIQETIQPTIIKINSYTHTLIHTIQPTKEINKNIITSCRYNEKYKINCYETSFNKKVLFMNKTLIRKMLFDYHLKSKNFKEYLKPYDTITIIKDIHNSTRFIKINHFNIILRNSKNKLCSNTLHANINENTNEIYNITELKII